MTTATLAQPKPTPHDGGRQPPVSVLVVDDHAADRLGVLRRVDGQPDVEAIAVGTGSETMDFAVGKNIDVGHGEAARARKLRRNRA